MARTRISLPSTVISALSLGSGSRYSNADTIQCESNVRGQDSQSVIPSESDWITTLLQALVARYDVGASDVLRETMWATIVRLRNRDVEVLNE